MFSRILIIISLIVLATACGKKDDGSSGSKSYSENYQTEDCKVKFSKEDTLTEIAQKSHQAKVDCKLSEDAVVKLVEASLM